MIEIPHKVFVTAPNWLGDAVMSLPLIGLLSGVDGVLLSVLAPRYTARVYFGIDGVEELFVSSGEGASRGFGKRARALRRLGASAVVILPPSFSSAVPPFIARVPNRIGYASDGRRLLLTKSLSAKGLREEHVSDNYMRLGRKALESMGLVKDAGFAAPKLRVFSNERISLERKLNGKNAPENGFCLVVPGAAYGPAKSWPEAAYREAVRRLSKTLPVVLAGGKADREAASRIGSDISGVFNMAGETTLGEFFALVERASVLVANDSGAPHVAGSLGTPAVVLFGSTSPKWTKPLGERVMVVREPILCSPCFLKECPTNLKCFWRIEPETVADHAIRLAEEGA